MITYYLVDNSLTPDPDDARAVVQPIGTTGLEEFVDRMVEQNTTLSRPVMMAVFSQVPDLIGTILSEGKNVTLPFGNYKATIQGKFVNMVDSFDSNRHAISVSVSATSPIQTKVKKAGTTKVIQGAPSPILLQFEDVASGIFDGTLSPGEIGKITGLKLKLDPSKAGDGIFFIPAGGGSEIKVNQTQIATNKNGELVFKIPTLAAGSYRLEVRVTYTNANVVRTGALDSVLTVQ